MSLMTRPLRAASAEDPALICSTEPQPFPNFPRLASLSDGAFAFVGRFNPGDDHHHHPTEDDHVRRTDDLSSDEQQLVARLLELAGDELQPDPQEDDTMNPYDSDDQTFRFKDNLDASIDGILSKADQPGTEDLRDDLRTADDRGDVMEILVDAIRSDEITPDEAVDLADQLEEIRDGDGDGGDQEEAPEQLEGDDRLPQQKADPADIVRIDDVESEEPEQKADPSDVVRIGGTDEQEDETLGDSINSRWGERTNGSGGE